MANNMAFYRRLKKMSQRELSGKIDVTPAYISQVENGKTTPNIEFKKKVSEILGVDVNKIFDSSIPKNPYIELIELLIINTEHEKIKWFYIDNSDIHKQPIRLIELSVKYNLKGNEFNYAENIYITSSKLFNEYLFIADDSKELYNFKPNHKGFNLIADTTQNEYIKPLNDLFDAIQNTIYFDDEVIENINELKSLLEED